MAAMCALVASVACVPATEEPFPKGGLALTFVPTAAASRGPSDRSTIERSALRASVMLREDGSRAKRGTPA
jgi:hypothetical protein